MNGTVRAFAVVMFSAALTGFVVWASWVTVTLNEIKTGVAVHQMAHDRDLADARPWARD